MIIAKIHKMKDHMLAGDYTFQYGRHVPGCRVGEGVSTLVGRCQNFWRLTHGR